MSWRRGSRAGAQRAAGRRGQLGCGPCVRQACASTRPRGRAARAMQRRLHSRPRSATGRPWRRCCRKPRGGGGRRPAHCSWQPQRRCRRVATTREVVTAAPNGAEQARVAAGPHLAVVRPGTPVCSAADACILMWPSAVCNAAACARIGPARSKWLHETRVWGSRGRRSAGAPSDPTSIQTLQPARGLQPRMEEGGRPAPQLQPRSRAWAMIILLAVYAGGEGRNESSAGRRARPPSTEDLFPPSPASL